MILLCLFALTALVGFSALAVDFGHIQVAKHQLQAGCDAAARAASRCLDSSLTNAAQIAAATNAAISIASQNTVDDQPILLDSSMVVIGNYDATKSPAFLAGRTPYNAARVNGYRDRAHSNPLLLALASAVGVTSFDINCVAVAETPPQPSTYGLAGVSSASFASIGVVSTLAGNLVSNGDVRVGMPLGIGVSVSGDARSFASAVHKGWLAHVAGSTAALNKALIYPSVVCPLSNNNATISANLDAFNNYVALGVTDIPAGVYVVHDLNLLAGVVLNLHGPVTFYVTGTFNMAASINLLNLLNTVPGNLNVMVCSGGSVNFVGGLITPVCMNIYAPDSNIVIAVTVNQFTGSIIGKTLDICVPAASTFVEGPPPVTNLQTALVQ